MSNVKKRSIVIAGHKTSISLEAEFFDAFKAVARRQNRTMAQAAQEVDSGRRAGTNLSSAIRLFVLADLQARVSEPAA